MSVLAVFQNVGNLCIAAAIGTGFCETNLDIVVSCLIRLYGRKAEGSNLLTCGLGIMLCTAADDGGEIASDLIQHNLTACL